MTDFTKAAMKLLDKAAHDYEEIDALMFDSDMNPSHREANEARIRELEKEADAISKTFGYWPEHP